MMIFLLFIRNESQLITLKSNKYRNGIASIGSVNCPNRYRSDNGLINNKAEQNRVKKYNFGLNNFL